MLLAGAAYRCWRLCAYDTVTEQLRKRLLRADTLGMRTGVAEFVQCPWCLGFHVSLGIYLLWLWQPTATMYVVVPFALSAAVGFMAQLDR